METAWHKSAFADARQRTDDEALLHPRPLIHQLRF
jgi:hypothetical protein